MPILAILFTTPRRYAHKAQKGHFLGDARGLVPGMQGDGFAIEPGGIMEVAVWFCLSFLLGL
jgi:hypothetical protein